MARKIVITSGKGGVGKTTIVANLGLALANIGENVVLVDLDIGLNNLDVALGIEKKVMFDLVDVLQGKCRIKQALIQHEINENLFVLACNQSLHKQLLINNLQAIVSRLSDNFDWILIDCPAGIGEGFLSATSCANESIVVVTPHVSSIRDADKVLSILASKSIKNINLIVNRIRGDMVVRGEMMSANNIADQLRTKLVGIIPESDDISLFSLFENAKEPLVPKQAFVMIAKNLKYDKAQKFDYISKYRGIFGYFRRTIKRRV